MNKVELKIINSGFRALVYKTRNASLILFGLTLLIFLIGVSVTSEASSSGTMLAYIFMISVAALLISVLLAVALVYKKVVGTIFINADDILFTDGQKTIKLTRLQILLNSDKVEFEQAKKDSKYINKILKTRHRIVSDDLPSDQNNWEVVLTANNRNELFSKSDLITLTPQFDTRPILMESPKRLLDTIAQFLHGWG